MIDWQRLIPMYWMQNEPTCRKWDKILNDALDKYEPKNETYHSVTIGPLEVWIANWPYCYGYCSHPIYKMLPKVSTRKRLRKIIEGMKRDPLDDIRALMEDKP